MSKEALGRAIAVAGGQTAFADKLGVRQSHVWFWLNKSAKGIPAEHCYKAEQATGISRHDLRPDIYPQPEPEVA